MSEEQKEPVDLLFRMVAIEGLMAGVNDDINNIHMALTEIHKTVVQSGANEPEQKIQKMRDDVWACENCAARLGIYNPAKEELRVRYKDFVCYVTPGLKGSVRIPCRRCGLVNELLDTRPTGS